MLVSYWRSFLRKGHWQSVWSREPRFKWVCIHTGVVVPKVARSFGSLVLGTRTRDALIHTILKSPTTKTTTYYSPNFKDEISLQRRARVVWPLPSPIHLFKVRLTSINTIKQYSRSAGSQTSTCFRLMPM